MKISYLIIPSRYIYYRLDVSESNLISILAERTIYHYVEENLNLGRLVLFPL